jgi:hypothetical protein
VLAVDRLRLLVRHLGIASLAGIVSGFLVAGVLGRIAMRVSGAMARPELAGATTENGNRVGEITLLGTLAIAIFVGLFAGLAGGIFYAAAEPWLRPSPWKGVIFGAGLLIAFGFMFIDPSNFDFRRFGSAPLNVAMFSGIFIAFGAVVAYLYDRIRGVIERSGGGAKRMGLEAVTWLAALAGVAFATIGAVSVGGLDVTAIPSLLPFAAAAIVPPLVLWRGLPRYVGYAGFAVSLLVGGMRTLDGVIQLVR